MPSPPSISAAEWEVMEVLWKRGPMTSVAVCKALKRKHWAANTIRTLLTRLAKKGALTYAPEGNCYVYCACIQREQYVREEVNSLAARLFGGAAIPLLIHFVQNEKLSKDEISELKKILDEKANQ